MMKKRYLPLLMGASMIVGMLIVWFLYFLIDNGRFGSERKGENEEQLLEIIDDYMSTVAPQTKVNEILNILDKAYVDSLNMKALEDSLSSSILSHLDPHSTYLSPEEVQKEAEHFSGHFSGVGMYFMVFEDTIYVTGVMPNTPSARSGLMPGDRIVMIDDIAFTGDSIKSDDVAKRVRGEKDTEVKFTVKRLGVDELLNFHITRANVPSNSVDAAFLLKDNIGIISINSFIKTTYTEFITSAMNLKEQGANKIIVDLRDNGGGMLNEVVLMANEFLKKDQEILYIEGNKFPRKSFYADGQGALKNMQLAVLINELSASASEIFAGAIQDNDRGIVVGRRSFGKGLVQQSFSLKDGSEARVTIARYYIPSGRCIQKPYVKGDNSSYMEEFFNRFSSGEIYNNDSIKNDTTKIYRTAGGRIVYGGGGITPDFFVPLDTIPYSKETSKIFNTGLPNKFIIRYIMNNVNNLRKYSDYKSLEKYIDGENLEKQFTRYCADKGNSISAADMAKSREQLIRYFKMQIIRNRFLGDDNEFYRYLYSDDKIVQKAVKELK